jgi:hypothetical protein
MGTGIVTKQISPETENWIFQVKNFPHQLHTKLIPRLSSVYYSIKGEKTKKYDLLDVFNVILTAGSD